MHKIKLILAPFIYVIDICIAAVKGFTVAYLVLACFSLLFTGILFLTTGSSLESFLNYFIDLTNPIITGLSLLIALIVGLSEMVDKREEQLLIQLTQKEQ